MKIAILSDIHGNIEALNTVLAYLDANEITEIYCLGDVVGYGPNPNECVDLISERCNRIVIGNHDHAAIGLTSTEYFNDFAKIATAWTASVLNEENKAFLSSLEFAYHDEEYLLVHATPSQPSLWHYILSEVDAQHEFRQFEERICFIGHSHFPIVFLKQGYTREQSIKLSKRNKYIINVGSVGQPRDGNPMTCFCVYNSSSNKLDYIRLEYDIALTREKIVKAGLPVFLGDRLIKGY
jgi:predicted phosphodiesterase